MKLSKEQENIIEHLDGPIRIIAGPGSGKTHTMVSKISKIRENKMSDLKNILVFSFTNKSVLELKNRVTGTEEELENITTFHAFCYKILREFTKYTLLDKN